MPGPVRPNAASKTTPFSPEHGPEANFSMNTTLVATALVTERDGEGTARSPKGSKTLSSPCFGALRAFLNIRLSSLNLVYFGIEPVIRTLKIFLQFTVHLELYLPYATVPGEPGSQQPLQIENIVSQKNSCMKNSLQAEKRKLTEI